MLRERRRHANFKPNRRLDRKSSRGMIYENEELRLRTININAEVERGQSNIRKLRRENEQLRREIWSLRDEYDRLNKLLRTNRSTESFGGGGVFCEAENNGNNSGTQGEESDSCDTCKDDDEDEDIICDEMHCNLHNRSKCNQDHHNFHQQQQQHFNQPSSSSCSNESKKKNLSSPLPTTSSPLSSLSNNGSKEITENYENSQKSILDNNSSGSSSSNYKNCNNTNCSSPAGPSSKIYNTTTASLTNIDLGRDSSPGPGSIPAFVPGDNADVDANNDRNNTISSRTNIISSESCTGGSDKLRENLHVNFDHLSIVSEENLTNSDGNSVQQNDIDQLSLSPGVIEILNIHEPTISAIAGSAGTIRTIATTVVPTKDTNNKHMNRISDIESWVPPLSHFENISYENIGSSLADLEDVNYSTSATTTGDTVIAANGWNFSAPATVPVKSKSLTSTTTSTGVQTLDDISSSSSSSIINHHNQKLISTEMAISSSLKISQHLLDTDSSSLSAIDSKSPKHFFSPLKPQLNVDLKHSLSTPSSPLIINAFEQQQHKQQKKNSEKYANYNGPDVFVANALASSSSSPYHTQIMKQQKNCRRNNTEPIYASVQKPLSSSLKMYGESSFQTGGNLEDLLMDIETLSKDILQMQLKKQKPLSEDKLDGGGNDEEGNLLNRKPFRSEMNLVLTYNGINPVITPIMKSTTSTSLNYGLGKDGYYGSTVDKDFLAATTMERRSTRGTPPLPNVPEPMTLFPENRPYLGFENFDQPPITSLAGGKSIMSIFKAQKKRSSTSEISDILSSPIIDSPSNIDTNVTTTTVIDKTTSNIPNHNEEKSVKTAGTVNSKQLLLDKKKNKIKNNTTGNFASETTNCDSSSGSESTVKKKSRRISILFKKSEDSSQDAKRGSEECQNENKIKTIPVTEISSDHQPSDITNEITMTKLSALNNESQANLINDEKNIQDSPHSERHRSNSSPTSGCHPHHHHHGHSHHHHNQNRKMSQDSGTGKHSSKLAVSPGDGDSDNAVTISSYIQEQETKSLNSHRTTKCGRRHSEGTVLATMAEGSGSNDGGNDCGSDTSGGGGNHRGHQHHHSHSGISGHRVGVVGGASGGVSTSGHHHHHHHHHHHARHDSYNDGVGGTSLSERNSNSLASSRESLTSLSTRSQRRKISISSHSGGKIPWCGCWGNGCL